MPVYDHKCQNDKCQHEWEDEYSIKVDPPTTCPKCLQETAKRLISLGGKGKVELYGQDLIDKLKSDAKKEAKEIYNSDKKYANMIGEDHYHKIQTRLDRKNR